MAGHKQGRHPPIAWTARIAGSRRDSIVFQVGFELQVNIFRHSAAGRKHRHMRRRRKNAITQNTIEEQNKIMCG